MISRRALLTMPAALRGQSREGITREVFLRSPGKGTAVMAYAWYTRKTGGAMRSLEQRWSRSDTIDVAYYRDSNDNGKTWSPPEERKTAEPRPEGMMRRHPRSGWVDPRNGRYVEFFLEGVLPSDDPLEGLRRWRIYYTIDGGPVRQVIERGAGFTAEHPLPGVWHGKNAAMIGDMTCQPVACQDRILLPVEIGPLNPDGTLANPGGGYTYHDAAIVHGRWRGNDLEWKLSELIPGDPARSTRGAVEPTIEALDGGRLICVMRGSNDRKPELPSWRWVSFSSDGGWKWSRPEPWTYDDGGPFYSASSCSQLLRPSSGRLYWLGNLNAENPRGNRPRYPFVIGEVDRASGKLRRESVRAVDDKGPQEDPLLTLSNFYAREDRATKEIAVHMTRLFAFNEGWVGDAMLYRVRV